VPLGTHRQRAMGAGLLLVLVPLAPPVQC